MSVCSQRSTLCVSTTPRKARLNALRLSASSTQDGRGCNQAPLPSSRRRRSTSATLTPPRFTANHRTREAWSSRPRQPMQVRTGWWRNDISPIHSSAKGVDMTHWQILEEDPRCFRLRRRPKRCRCAIRSASLQAAHSGLPCRSQETADSPARRRGRCGFFRP